VRYTLSAPVNAHPLVQSPKRGRIGHRFVKLNPLVIRVSTASGDFHALLTVALPNVLELSGVCFGDTYASSDVDNLCDACTCEWVRGASAHYNSDPLAVTRRTRIRRGLKTLGNAPTSGG